jgi:hypothetical protein
MAHLLQVLAQHWHLSASQYWQLRLLCSISLGPLLGVLCLLLFKKRRAAARIMVQRVRRLTRAVTCAPPGYSRSVVGRRYQYQPS